MVIGITDKTRIIKAKKPGPTTFDDLAADQEVTGIEPMDAAGKWQAETLDRGRSATTPGAAGAKDFYCAG